MKVFKLAKEINGKKLVQSIPGEQATTIALQQEHMQDSSRLYSAIWSGNLRLVKRLVEKGETLATDKFSPFMLACYCGMLEIAKYLYAKKIVNERDAYGNTSLMYAAEQGHRAVVAWLLKKKVDLNAVNIHGNSALFTSLRYKHPSIAHLLLDQAQIEKNAVDVLSYTPLVVAVFNRYLDIAESLEPDVAVLNRQYTENNTLLHMCAMSGNTESVAWLLEKGVDPHILNSFNLVPLELAASKGHIDVMKLIIPKMLRNARFDDALAFSMVFASMHGQNDLLDLVLSYKQDFSPVFYQLVLMSAALNGHWDVMSRILDLNQEKMIKNMNKCYQFEGSEFNNNRTLLHSAAEKGHLNVIENLFERGADMSVRDNNGDTVLHHAIRSGNLELVRWLCNHNALVDAQNKQGNTPMHFALQKHSPQMIRCLLLHGASFTIENNQEESVEFLAKPHRKLNRCIVDFKDKNLEQFGLSRIHEAVIDEEDKSILQTLPVENNLFTRCEDGLTPIELATRLGNHRPLLILLLWEVKCNRQNFFVLVSELQKKYDPKSKAFKTLEHAQLAMRKFPSNRLEALVSLMNILEPVQRDEVGIVARTADKPRRQRLNTFQFFAPQTSSTRSDEAEDELTAEIIPGSRSEESSPLTY